MAVVAGKSLTGIARLFALVMASCPLLPGQCSQPAKAATVGAGTMYGFQNSVAVATHLSYNDGAYADAPSTLAEIRFLGLHHVRDGIPAGSQPNEVHALETIHYLMAGGVHFTFILGGSQSIPQAVHKIAELARIYPNAIDAVEGPNEIDNFPVPGPHGGEENARVFQHTLYDSVHNDPALKEVPVLYMTGAKPIALSTQHGLADRQNTHPYAQAGQMPWEWILKADCSGFTDPAGFPKATTESGYTTELQGNYNGVDPDTQAELLLTNLFDLFLTGHTPNAIYQLREAYPNATTNADTAFGLFTYAGAPKPAAMALHRLFGEFPQEIATNQTEAPHARSDLPATARALALAANRGATSLWLWNEVLIWNPNIQKRVTAPAEETTVFIAAPAHGSWVVALFDPIRNESTPVLPVLRAGRPLYPLPLRTHPTALIFRPKS